MASSSNILHHVPQGKLKQAELCQESREIQESQPEDISR